MSAAAAAAETLLAMRLLLRLLYSQCALLSAGHSIVSSSQSGRL